MLVARSEFVEGNLIIAIETGLRFWNYRRVGLIADSPATIGDEEIKKVTYLITPAIKFFQSGSGSIGKSPLYSVKIFHRSALMINKWLFLATVLISGSAGAKTSCTDINGQQSYPPLSVTDGVVCFVQEPLLDSKTNAPIGADAISLYFISDGSIPTKAEGRGLLYDDTPGEIVDAFSSGVGHDHSERVFVIHSVEIRKSLVEPNSSGKFYSVSVFEPRGTTLRRNERVSEWFGADYSWQSDGQGLIYKFPYQSRRDVQKAMDSPFALLMSADESIPIRLRNKSYLFDGPNVKDRTRKYLIKGDRATVDKTTAGWCHAHYFGGNKPIEIWLLCGALDVNAQTNK